MAQNRVSPQSTVHPKINDLKHIPRNPSPSAMTYTAQSKTPMTQPSTNIYPTHPTQSVQHSQPAQSTQQIPANQPHQMRQAYQSHYQNNNNYTTYDQSRGYHPPPPTYDPRVNPQYQPNYHQPINYNQRHMGQPPIGSHPTYPVGNYRMNYPV